MKTPTLFTTQQVAALYGISRQTVRNWAEQGEIPGAQQLNPRLWVIPDTAFGIVAARVEALKNKGNSDV